jgi:hypothetical protein
MAAPQPRVPPNLRTLSDFTGEDLLAPQDPHNLVLPPLIIRPPDHALDLAAAKHYPPVSCTHLSRQALPCTSVISLAPRFTVYSDLTRRIFKMT